MNVLLHTLVASTTYPTNVTDAQWQAIVPLITKEKPFGGRPTTVNIRDIVDALISMNRTGCQWRMIPRDFPKAGAIRYYFDTWGEDGTFVRITDSLRKTARTELDRDTEPSIAVLDSQNVKTTDVAGERGVDGGKKIKGRKRQVLVDTNDFLLRTMVHAADSSDTEGGEWIICEHQDIFPRLATIRVDEGSKESLGEWMQVYTDITLEVIEKPADQVGFAVLPKRWVVERTIAWMCRNRRLSKDYECLPERSESWIYLASINNLLNRIHPRK